MRYILFITAIMGGLLSFNSYAKDSCPALKVPFQFDMFLTHFVPTNNSDSPSYASPVLDIHGCSYLIMFYSCPANADPSHSGSFCTATSVVLLSDDGNINSPITDNIPQQIDQMNRYCAQAGKCDSKGFPVNTSDWLKFKEKDDAAHENPSEKPSEKPADSDNSGSGSSDNSGSSSGDSSSPSGGTGTPDGSDTGSGTTGGSFDGSANGSSSDSSAPSPSQPEKPYPDNASVNQLFAAQQQCLSDLDKFPLASLNNYDPSIDIAYNQRVKQCNDIYDKMSSLINTGSITSPYDDSHSFFTKSDRGSLYSCSRTPSYSEWLDNHLSGDVYPGELSGYQISKATERELAHCRMIDGKLSCSYSVLPNYTSYDGTGNAVCNSTYNKHLSDIITSGDLGANVDLSGHETSSPSVGSTGDIDDVYDPCLMPGQLEACLALRGDSGKALNSHSDSGDGDNGDVVAAINALHADVNKNHKESMDLLDLPVSTDDAMKGFLSPQINAIIDSTKKELTDSYNDAMAELKDVFGDIDSYVPDIKLSFDLPTQFTAGIMGRCVPLVFDFNISLVGLPSYHLHAEGVQACKLYDLYVRSIVEYMLYFMTAVACRRIFTRAAEFITSQS